MGRKPLAGEATTETPLRIRLTAGQRRLLDAAAAAAGRPTSTWAREVLLATAARRPGVSRRRKA